MRELIINENDDMPKQIKAIKQFLSEIVREINSIESKQDTSEFNIKEINMRVVEIGRVLR
jgi:hypothetical protein